MGFKCGIVGLPNVGKSTLFNALTNASIQAENYPFCTIDPNVGMVPVPDARLDKLAEIVQPQKVLPTGMEFVDIAGLVAGASKGEGLGNKFLGNIRETDAIVHVVRCFEDENVIHVEGKIDPLSDIEVIETELALADMEVIERALYRSNKVAKSGDKDAKLRIVTLEKVQQQLDKGDAVRFLGLDEDELEHIQEFHLLTQKPVLYIANVAEDGFDNNPYLDLVNDKAMKEGAKIVAVCAAIEADLVELDAEDQLEFLEELGLSEPGLNRVIQAGYQLLGLQTYFTAGEKEVRAWTIPIGATAPKAAAVIHTDFEKGFIRAEVTAYDDFVAHNGEQGARKAGRLRLEGKDYVVADGDVMHFLFNV